jgi:hypothetical protein
MLLPDRQEMHKKDSAIRLATNFFAPAREAPKNFGSHPDWLEYEKHPVLLWQ